VPAAWILDTLCGFKGYKNGEVGVYKNQALVLVNYGQGTAADIKNLAQKMTACVLEKTGIELEREVEFV
jgi:UDP-N-acetylmuramate dehydrogenase